MSFTVIKHIICELTGYRPGTMDVSQADRGSRAVRCCLLESGAPWMIPDGATARVAYTLPGGTEGLYDTMPDGSLAWQIDGNAVTVQLIDQLMAQPGMAHMSIVLIGSEGGQLATWPIRVNITPDKAARLTVPENLPPYGAGFAGKIFFGGADGTITPLTPGEGVEIVRQEDGSYALVAYGGAGGGGISEETDPTVAPWAKTGQPEPYGSKNPPPYPVTSVNGKAGAVDLRAEDVGALPAGTQIPGKTSDLTNDSGFIDKSVSDLVNYFTKKQTEDLIAQIPKFRIAVVQQLPAAGEELVLYLVPFATAEGQYLEYIWTGGRFEVIGSQRVDLTGYATEGWVQRGYQPKGDYLTEHQSLAHLLPREDLDSAINTALAQARDSGEFDGKDGRGIKSISRTSGTGAAGTVDTYTITYTDGTTGTYQVRNGANGRDGEDGISPHIGVNGNWYIGTTDTGVKAAEKGDPGDPGRDGRGIKSISRTSGTGAAGTVDTYTITYTDGTTGTYQVRNGANGRDGEDGISPHIGANGNWYIGTTDTGVKAAEKGDPGDPGRDGRGIKSISRTSGTGAAGTVDTYTITYTDGTTGTYQVRNGANGRDGEDGISPHIGDNGNWWIGTTDTGVKAAQKGDPGDPGRDGRGIASIVRTSGTGAAGTADTYTITYTDGTTGTYQVRNGANGRDGEDYELTDADLNAIAQRAAPLAVNLLPKYAGEVV